MGYPSGGGNSVAAAAATGGVDSDGEAAPIESWLSELLDEEGVPDAPKPELEVDAAFRKEAGMSEKEEKRAETVEHQRGEKAAEERAGRRKGGPKGPKHRELTPAEFDSLIAACLGPAVTTAPGAVDVDKSTTFAEEVQQGSQTTRIRSPICPSRHKNAAQTSGPARPCSRVPEF